MKLLRVINMRYLNSIPYRVLSKDSRLDYREGLPIECASALLQNDVDIALLPLASIFKHGLYNILPFGTVGEGPTQTAAVLSEEKLEEVTEILLDSSSETSVLLLRTLLAEFYPNVAKKVSFRVERPDRVITSIRGSTAGFVIGDRAMSHAGQFKYVYDLAELWIANTGKPFLFAAWAYRPDSLTEEQASLFCDILREGLKDRAHFAREWAEDLGINRETATRYVTEVIKFEIDSNVREGAYLFSTLAGKYNLLPGETSIGALKVFDHASRSEIPFVGTEMRPLMEAALDDATSYKRLSIAAAVMLASDLSLTELLTLTSLRKESRGSQTTKRLYRLSMTKHSTTGGQSLISPQEFQRISSNIDGILLAESNRCDELNLDNLELLLRTKNSNAELAVVTISDLELFSGEEHISIEEVLDRLNRMDVTILDGKTETLFSVGELPKALEHLELFRTAARFGFQVVTRVQIDPSKKLEEFAIHLFQLRQLQEQTDAIIAHIVEWANPLESTTLDSVELFARVFALSQLILDNVPSIFVSPLGYGAPVAELLVELGADGAVIEL